MIKYNDLKQYDIKAKGLQDVPGWRIVGSRNKNNIYFKLSDIKEYF